MIPIENTLHGSVHENYDHLLKFDFPIVAETSVRIVHNLIAPPGVAVPQPAPRLFPPGGAEPVPEVLRAEPAARARAVLRHRRQREDADGGAAWRMRRPSPPRWPPEIYGATILKTLDRGRPEELHAVLPAAAARTGSRRCPRGAQGDGRRRWCSPRATCPGSLFRALSAFALRDVNLVKIESRPLRGKPWEYLFYVDLIGRIDEQRLKNALGHLGELADFLRVLGCYPRGA